MSTVTSRKNFEIRPDKPVQPVVVPPGAALTVAHFTARELDTLRTICRDADNELGSRFLKAALARAVAK